MSKSPIPEVSATTAPAAPDFGPYRYAGFWWRFWALAVDRIIELVLISLAAVIWGVASGVGQAVALPNGFSYESFSYESWGSALSSADFVRVILLDWAYFALAESSAWQATPGKRFFHLKVVTDQGKPLSISTASIRYFAKYLSHFIFMIGYLMAAFTPRKQALHDMMAHCLVLKRVEVPIGKEKL